MPEGIDVSKWQGASVNWLEVKNAGIDFAVARSSIAGRTKDETFSINYPRMVARGLIPGAYHLVSGQSSGAEQAANWKQALDAVGFDKGLLVLDVEGWVETNDNPAATLEATEYLANWVRTTYKRTPIIYTGVYWRDALKQHPNNFGSELWLSYYGVNDPQLYVPKAWGTWKIWQYTSTGSVAGVEGNVDRNKSAGTLRSLKELAGWEWDELATQAEVRSIVAEEVGKAVVRLENTIAADGDANLSEVQTALRDVEVRLNTLIRANAPVLSRDEILAKFTEVLDAVESSELNDVDYSDDFVELAEMVDTLHKHVCTHLYLH